MSPLIFTLLLFLVPYQISAYSPCSRTSPGQAYCISKCAQLYKWAGAHPGMIPGKNRWGSVMEPGSFEDELTKICGSAAIPSATDTTGNATSESSVDPVPVSSTASPTAPLRPSGTATGSPTLTHPKSTPEVSLESSKVQESTKSFSTTTKQSLPTKILVPSRVSKPKPPASPSPSPSPSPPLFPSPAPSPSPSPAPAPAPSPSPAPAPPPSPSRAPSRSQSGNVTGPESGDPTAFLSGHNAFRAPFPIPSLTWSDKLAGTAQQWANNCEFEHSGGKFGSIGENIAAGAGGGYNIASAIKSWTDEEKDYNPQSPDASHFTQVVWKSTTEVGCGKAMCDGIFDSSFGKSLFVVCQYNPPGNFIGKFAANVFPRSN